MPPGDEIDILFNAKEAIYMGPTIILDKSAYQSLSREDTRELSRYFYVVVPPVLILEILADLKKPGIEPSEAQDAVQQLARRIQPVEGIVNLGYRTLCIYELLGGKIPMDRRPVVGGGHRVLTANGSPGAFIDVQPENQALVRWSRREFDEAEKLLATRWREACRAIDLEGFRSQLRAGMDKIAQPSLHLVREVVDQVLATASAQCSLLEPLLADLRTIPEVREWTLARWRQAASPNVKEFAPFALHCIRVRLIFEQALVHGLIGTRSTNRIDMEYLYYSPFAHVFSSGDKLHIAMATEVLAQDQSFVPRDDLRLALREVAEARRKAREIEQGRPEEVQPEENSLIRKLWIKHLGHWPEKPPGLPRHLSKEEEERLIKEVQPFMDACNKARAAAPAQRRWPCP